MLNDNFLDLRGYSAKELALEVFNTQDLYFLIDPENIQQPRLMDAINQRYIYNGSQFDHLMDAIDNAVNEWRV